MKKKNSKLQFKNKLHKTKKQLSNHLINLLINNNNN